MNLIGMLLTALVVAREWERGTIEALFSTKITKLNLIIGKYVPYFILGFFALLCAEIGYIRLNFKIMKRGQENGSVRKEGMACYTDYAR